MVDSSVAGFYFEKAGQSTYSKTTTVDGDDYSDVIAQPSSGKYLVITHIYVQPTVVLLNGGLSIRIYDGDGVSQGNIFASLGCGTLIISPFEINMSECPIVLDPDYTLKAKVENAGDDVYVICRGFVI